MARWYPKEFSKLTKVSVRALYHYDAIGLLKPSARLSTGYRLYSETDLLKLQQIVALKFLGFKLELIKNMLLQNGTSIVEHLRSQQRLLQEEMLGLQKANHILDAMILSAQTNGSVDWQQIVELLNVYTMTDTLKKRV